MDGRATATRDVINQATFGKTFSYLLSKVPRSLLELFSRSLFEQDVNDLINVDLLHVDSSDSLAFARPQL